MVMTVENLLTVMTGLMLQAHDEETLLLFELAIRVAACMKQHETTAFDKE